MFCFQTCNKVQACGMSYRDDSLLYTLVCLHSLPIVLGSSLYCALSVLVVSKLYFNNLIRRHPAVFHRQNINIKLIQQTQLFVIVQTTINASCFNPKVSPSGEKIYKKMVVNSYYCETRYPPHSSLLSSSS